MRLIALSALAGLIIVPTFANAQPASPPAAAPKFVFVDDPPLCNAAGLAPAREQPAGYTVPADKGGGTLAYVDKSRAECHQMVGRKALPDHRRPTICPLGSGRTNIDGVWHCRTQKLATGA